MNGAPESQTAASASFLVGPYPIDEDALRRLKRLHDGGVIDDYTFTARAVSKDLCYSIFYFNSLARRQICALRSTSGRNWCLRKS